MGYFRLCPCVGAISTRFIGHVENSISEWSWILIFKEYCEWIQLSFYVIAVDIKNDMSAAIIGKINYIKKNKKNKQTNKKQQKTKTENQKSKTKKKKKKEQPTKKKWIMKIIILQTSVKLTTIISTTTTTTMTTTTTTTWTWRHLWCNG